MNDVEQEYTNSLDTDIECHLQHKQLPLILMTWNVLHMIHEWNYNRTGKTIKLFKDEKERIIKIIKIISEFLDYESQKNNDVVFCLQEASGDLLEGLLLELSSKYNVLYYEYDRIPMIKPEKFTDPSQMPTNDIYQNPKEYLITIVTKSLEIISDSVIKFPFDIPPKNTPYGKTLKDSGKAAFIVETNRGVFMNIHSPPKAKFTGTVAIPIVQEYILQNKNKNMILLGDFNATLPNITCRLKNLLKNYNLDITSYTDPKNLVTKPHPYIKNRQFTIDHMLSIGNIHLFDDKVIDVKWLSDHNILLSKAI
mgnify:CR=1 FL=1